MRVGGLWPSIMSADVPHLSLNYPFLKAMAVPSCVALFVCVSADSVAVCVFWGGGGGYPGGLLCLSWISRMMSG